MRTATLSLLRYPRTLAAALHLSALRTVSKQFATIIIYAMLYLAKSKLFLSSPNINDEVAPSQSRLISIEYPVLCAFIALNVNQIPLLVVIAYPSCR